ncbi:hypothetical protein PCANC_28428 [Puccinia coronata f. sp. avenae]|uniref:Uncharacterized protein n=1 Tax=Puccinia coronata f. sp. avenae TaxID=200324 RepID=A0A2N5TI05_9BASI|nr:hypothetical protein PCANC_28428 [Puccinia coronata f. sp. avenae]
MKELRDTPEWNKSADRLTNLPRLAANRVDTHIPCTTIAKRANQAGKLKILLAIDEPSFLLDYQDPQRNMSYFCVFRQVLSKIPARRGFFSVFSNTTSKVVNLSPALDNDSSARQAGQGHKLFPPISCNKGVPSYIAILDTTNIAKAKLLVRSATPSVDELTSRHVFALLGSIIQTRLHLKSSIHLDLVLNHAAHCMFIDPDQEFVTSSYPSQFVYAAAASTFLSESEAHWIKLISVLASAVQNGLVADGD